MTESRLERQLGTWTATAVVVGAIVGSGIFRLPGSVAALAGSTGAVIVLWVLGGVIALCGALSLAEMAAMFPRTGGIYVILRETYGPWAAFLFGWAMLVVNPAAYAFVALLFAESLTTLVPALQGAERVVAALSLLALVAVNVRPVRIGAQVLHATTWAKVLALVVFSLFAIVVSAAGPAAAPDAPVQRDVAAGTGFGLALLLVMGAYDGWQWVPQLAGELRDPARSLPRALGLGVLLVVGVYLLANAANLLVLSPAQLTRSTLVTRDVALAVAGSAGASIVAALVLVSTFGANQSAMMTDPRVFFAMGGDGLFFRAVAAVHPRHHTPHVAVMLIGGGGIAYVFVRSFEELVGTLILGMWPFLAMAVAAVIVTRLRQPRRPRPFRVPLYPLPPLLFLAACAGLFANSLYAQPGFTAMNIAVIAAGLPVYSAWRAWAGGAGRVR